MTFRSRARKVRQWGGTVLDKGRQFFQERQRRRDGGPRHHSVAAPLPRPEHGLGDSALPRNVARDVAASPGSQNPALDAIRGNPISIWGVEGVPGSGTLRTCNDGGAALQQETIDITNRSNVSPGPMAFGHIGAWRLAQQESSGLELDLETTTQPDPVADARKKLVEMDTKLREVSSSSFKGSEYYISNQHVDSTITLEAVRAVLPCVFPDMSPEKLHELARDICGRDVDGVIHQFRKIFAILVLIDKVDSILKFVKAGVTDATLPLKRLGDNRLFNLGLTTEDKSEIRLFRSWEQRSKEVFEARQWDFLAPFFSRGTKDHSWVRSYPLSWRQPVPFEIIPDQDCPRAQGATTTGTGGRTKDFSTSGSMPGGNSKVSKVVIHPSHHNLQSYRGDESNPRLAIKELWTTDRDTFKNEVNILTRLNKCNDPHLVKLLLTMERNDRREKDHNSFYLIFPLADGNLRQFWHDRCQGANLATYGHWAAKQFYGLVWALCKLHDLHERESHEVHAKDEQDDKKSSTGDPFYGIHGDIKPENLLWYERWVGPDDHQACPGIIPPTESAPFGVLQLADFGISKLHRTATRSRVHLTKATKTYAPPEFEWGFNECSRSFDIWSLGCVFLEFLCWLVQSSAEPGAKNPIDEFQEERRLDGTNKSLEGTCQDTFYHLVPVADGAHTKVEVNPAVTKLIGSLRRSPNSSDFVNDMLDIILYRMLVVEGRPATVGQTSSELPKRIKCVDLATKLKAMVSDNRKEDYFTGPRPASPITPDDPHAVTIRKSMTELIKERRRSKSRTFPQFNRRGASPMQDGIHRPLTIHEIPSP